MDSFDRLIAIRRTSALMSQSLAQIASGIMRKNGIEDGNVQVKDLKSRGLLGRVIGHSVEVSGTVDGLKVSREVEIYHKSGTSIGKKMENLSSEITYIDSEISVDPGFRQTTINGEVPHRAGLNAEDHARNERLLSASSEAIDLAISDLEPVSPFDKKTLSAEKDFAEENRFSL